MGPRGGRLPCTKRHFRLLMWSVCQEGKSGGKVWEKRKRENWTPTSRLQSVGQVSPAFLPAAESSHWAPPSGLLLLLHPHNQRRAAAQPTRPKQYKPISPFLWRTCSHPMFVTVSVLLLLQCLFTLPPWANVSVLVSTALKMERQRVSAWEWVVYKWMWVMSGIVR